MIRNMDWPGADDIADRMKLMLPPQIQQAEEKEEEGQQIPPQVQQAIQMAQEHIQQQDQAIQELQGQLQQADTESQAKLLELQIKEREVAIKEQELIIKGYQAETDRLTKLPPMDMQGLMAIVRQTVAEMIQPAPIYEQAPIQQVVEGQYIDQSQPIM